MDVNADAVAAAFREHGVSRLIHGHTHRPARHELVIDGRHCERWVLADGFSVGDVTIPRGAKIAMLFGAATRDPRVFGQPDTFDVGRENAAQHIGFGGGIHVCIGAPLARIELEASVDALRRYWPEFELGEEPRRCLTDAGRRTGDQNRLRHKLSGGLCSPTTIHLLSAFRVIIIHACL